ncbi:hypothetical protein FSP39_022788 [Pinctada imbricata]|uniref:PHD-type domain-containing protein n=1 Tax=Pinctada imbricata TaxID=66713 RepID=A0AA89BQN9_PINIB|nr:hypothetical protein FSP39_022788 [Pinctada imbricata]
MLLVLLSILSSFKKFPFQKTITGDPIFNQLTGSHTVIVNKCDDCDFSKEILIRYANRKSIEISKQTKIDFLIFKLLLLGGDVSTNPGPTKYPCVICSKGVRSNQQGIQCDFCDYWTHCKCVRMGTPEYERLGKSEELYFCIKCSDRLPVFTESFFEGNETPCSYADDPHVNSSLSCTTNEHVNIFDQLIDVRLKHPKRFTCAYLNVNSVRHKFDMVKDLLIKNVVDLLFLAETKIDEDNFHLWRADRNASGGGILAYLRSDLAGDRRKDLEFQSIESIGVEVTVNKDKLFILGSYRPPSMKDEVFLQDSTSTLDKISSKYDNFIIMGDLNYDLNDESKCQPLQDLCDIFDLSNIIKGETCFPKHSKPSQIDVVLSNNQKLFPTHCNFNCGVSDVHNIIAFQLYGEVPSKTTKWSQYRSFKSLDLDSFKLDLHDLETEFSRDNFEGDVNTVFNKFHDTFTGIINKHIPVKKRKVYPKPAPFMNKELKSAIFKKRELQNKYFSCRTNATWEKYRKQRNLCTSIRRKSINKYFLERCAGGPKSTDFWPTIKPFITNKGNSIKKDIVLSENDTLVCDQSSVSETFNEFFVNVAKNIGINSIDVDETHPSVQKIQNHLSNTCTEEPFIFEPVDESFVSKCIGKLGVRKATGIDGISAKIVKMVGNDILKPLTCIVNFSLLKCSFPDRMKIAQVVPLHKKNSTLDKGNYRPVSV